MQLKCACTRRTRRASVWQPPLGEGVRVDHGLLSGQEISPFYDPMIAKIIAWGEDRHTACRRLVRALENTVLFGVENNRRFLLDVLRRPAFVAGEATTAFIEQQFQGSDLETLPMEPEIAALAAVLFYRESQSALVSHVESDHASAWGWRTGRPVMTHYQLSSGDEPMDVSVLESAAGVYSVSVADELLELEFLNRLYDHCAQLLVAGVRRTVWFAATGRGELSLQSGGRAARVVNQLAFTAADQQAAGSGTVQAPMHGNLLELAVAVGDSVAEGQLLAVMEAMKMEHRLQAEVAGTVHAVHVAAGQQLAAGELILEIGDG